MDMRFEQKNGFTIIGIPIQVSMTNNSKHIEIKKFWNTCNKNGTIQKLKNAADPNSKLGVMGICDSEIDEEIKSFTYLIGIEAPLQKQDQEILLPDSCITISVPKSIWAVFEVHGPIPKSIQTVWIEIFSEWFPSSGYEHALGPDLEVYTSSLPPNSNDYYCEIWIPITKR